MNDLEKFEKFLEYLTARQQAETAKPKHYGFGLPVKYRVVTEKETVLVSDREAVKRYIAYGEAKKVEAIW